MKLIGLVQFTLIVSLFLKHLIFITFCINKSLLFQMALIIPLLKLLHCTAIVYVTFLLYEINKTLPALYVGIQMLLTLFIILFSPKQQCRDWKQLFFSLSLVYALRPTDLNVLRFIFLAKIFYVYRSLAEVSSNLFIGTLKFFRLMKVAFDFMRLAAVFYLTMGCMIVVYKYWAYLWTDPEKVLSTHQILYFFMVTSSSIGFGDITPKNEYQMYFLIAFIPVLIIIFGQLCGQAVSYFSEFIAILGQNPQSNEKASLLSEGVWGKEDCTNLIDYIAHAQSRNASIQQDKQIFANNWLSLACKNYEVHQPLLMQILDSEDSKEYKLLVASKLKRQFYPNNWKIIQKDNTDRHFYMIQEGQVEVNGQLLGPGKTFNMTGFSRQEPSAETYLTKSFTSVWAISQADLVEIGRNSINLRTKISKKFSLLEQGL